MKLTTAQLQLNAQDPAHQSKPAPTDSIVACNPGHRDGKEQHNETILLKHAKSKEDQHAE